MDTAVAALAGVLILGAMGTGVRAHLGGNLPRALRWVATGAALVLVYSAVGALFDLDTTPF